MADNKVFQVSVDADELRGMFNRYGQAVLDAAVDKVAVDLKHKIKAALKLGDLTGIAKPLVEIIK